MFLFKQHARRSVIMIAAVAASVGLAAVSHAATIDWTGDGDLNAGSSDDVFFNGTGTVNVNDPTTVNSLTFNAGSHYTIQGEAITINQQTYAITSSGNNTITSDIEIPSMGNGGAATLKVDDGTLTINTISFVYGMLIKTGDGVLRVNSSLGGSTNTGLAVEAGTLILSSGSNNTLSHISQGISVYPGGTCVNIASGATLGGNASIQCSSGGSFDVYGNLAPGDGDIGTFALTSAWAAYLNLPNVTFHAGSALCIDIDPDDNDHYDVFKMVIGDNSGGSLAFEKGATICINGDVVPDYEYKIIELVRGGYNDGTKVIFNPDDLNNITVDFSSNLNLTYHFEILPGEYGSYGMQQGSYIALVFELNHVPEPASLGFLGLGYGLLLFRGKRRG
ncbi:MAG: hypothetical protein FWD61_05430 [Phycisphaerales bacterium]|nr:hypothetical protein [Phycisphaerales bacterium]